MRDLLASKEPAAYLAVDCFVYQVLRHIGALSAVLGGVDAIVFIAGIGERSAEIRRCRRTRLRGAAQDGTDGVLTHGHDPLDYEGHLEILLREVQMIAIPVVAAAGKADGRFSRWS